MNKILFIDLPPLAEADNIVHNHKGISYIMSYLKDNDIECDLSIFFNKELNDFIHSDIIASKFQRIKQFSTENFIGLVKETFQKELMPIIDDYDILAFSLFSVNSALIFDEIYKVMSTSVDLSKFKLIIGGNYLRYTDNIGKFEKYTEHICSGNGELYFQKMFDLPNFKLFSYNQYLSEQAIDDYKISTMPHLLSIFFGDGCVNHCQYCINAIRKDKVFYRDIDDTIREIVYFKKKGIKSFYLDSENFTNNINFVNKFTKKLKFLNTVGLGEPIHWATSLSPFNEHKKSYTLLNFKDLNSAGCSHIIFGVESFSEDTRDLMGIPKYSNDELYEATEHILKHNINLEINVITAYYLETSDDFEEAYLNLEQFLNKFSDVIQFKVNEFIILQSEDMGHWSNGDTIEYDENGDWFYHDNNLQERIRRFNKMDELLNKYPNLNVERNLRRER